jgi:hypothetical protein
VKVGRVEALDDLPERRPVEVGVFTRIVGARLSDVGRDDAVKSERALQVRLLPASALRRPALPEAFSEEAFCGACGDQARELTALDAAGRDRRS